MFVGEGILNLILGVVLIIVSVLDGSLNLREAIDLFFSGEQ